MKLPDKISNEDYVVDSDEIMEDATQETNTQNDKDESSRCIFSNSSVCFLKTVSRVCVRTCSSAV